VQDSVEETNEKQVADGARYLDLNAPGWFRSIDLNRLNMSNPCCCVVGQLFYSFAVGLEQLDVDPGAVEDVALGFDRSDSLGLDYSRDLAALTPIWKREIEARLAATS